MSFLLSKVVMKAVFSTFKVVSTFLIWARLFSLPQLHKALWPILWQFECITLIPHGSGSVTGSNILTHPLYFS